MSGSTAIGPTGDDIRPIVASPASNRGLRAFLALLALIGGLLFYALEMRRERITAPSISGRPADYSDTIAAPPDLALPPDWQASLGDRAALETPPFRVRGSSTVLVPQTPAQPSRVVKPVGPAIVEPPSPAATPVNSLQQPVPSSPPAIFTGARPAPPELERSDETENGKERVEARRFNNPSTTVAKGTVIQAVLETALDSTRAGFARSIVSRDVYGFDGTRILIPRGSRIIGEYKSDVTIGQKRVLIQWQRLTRPDGVIIDMNSPSADPLGRAGVTGQVNSHFLQRFAGAILQSALDVGTQLATRRVSRDSIYIGLPGVAPSVVVTPEKIQPTIKVKQGSSVSVFVARDLDFTSVE